MIFQALIHVINALSGFSLLAMPFALAKGGWLSLGALIVISAICTYTSILLKRCMDFNSLVKTYPDIGNLAFGNKGRIISALLMHIELYFVAVGLLIIEGENISKIFPRFKIRVLGHSIRGRKVFVPIATLLILPTTWPRNLRALSFLSMGGFLVSLFLCGLVLWIGAFEGVGFREKGDLVDWAQLPISLSIFMFSNGGHAVIPTIYSSIKNHTKFSIVWAVGIAICTVQNALMGVTGYLMFGGRSESIVTLNFPPAAVISKIAIWTVIAIPLVKYALIMMPVNNSVEEQLQIRGRLASVLIRTALVISTGIIALAVPNFSQFLSLVGSLVNVWISIILPCLCYLKIYRASLKWGLKVMLILCSVCVGGLIMLLGTYVSIKNV